MATTIVRASRMVPVRDEDVMGLTFDVTPRSDGAPPADKDTLRVGATRRIVAARLRHCGLERMTDDVTLIVSEFLTNALLHSGTTEISLTIGLRNGCLQIAVRDGMAGCAELSEAGEAAESGRGLTLVDHLVDANGGAWGTSEAGAVTWCRLAVPAKEKA
ncbi:ATP-binding protein [Streptomyces sp. NPDC005236]|uniref:ATP-binding protein n=1 Tax=Streptomyces sp. NPDC005236 TaxID=3157028 RepID=UPI0033A4D5C7